MCKRNSPHENEASTGCVRETAQIKIKPAWDKRNSSNKKNEASTGCVIETPHRKVNPAWDV